MVESNIEFKVTCNISLQKYTDVQFSPDTGLQILGNTSSTVQYSVVGDTTNMEYSVVGPKTVSSQVSQMIVVIICIVACYNLVLASLSHNNYTEVRA